MDKPPIEVRPKKIHDALRIVELATAISRYVECGLLEEKYDLIDTWKNELDSLIDNYYAFTE